MKSRLDLRKSGHGTGVPVYIFLQAVPVLQIPILSTKYILFETAGILYNKGIVGCLKKVESDSLYK